MRNKKLLSTVMASMLVVTTMVMPVMAAESGSVNIDLTTKTAVIRVKVPTSMNMSVNQFEIGDTGSQIYSNAFEMENKSEIPVKVDVTSTVEKKGASTKFLATKAAAEESDKAGEAWMSVAAQTSAGKYIEDDSEGNARTIADLTEANDNVVTFTEKDSKVQAGQTFYLDASGTMAYKMLNKAEDATDLEYAEFYELTEQTIADDADAQTNLDTLVANNDVYVATTAPENGKAGPALTKIAKGTTTQHPYANTEAYYTPAITATAKSAIDGSKFYVYGDGTSSTSDPVKAAFRYIGKLSEGQETWTRDDIEKVKVSYTIVGVKESMYDEIAATTGALTYGLYKEIPKDTAPSIATTSYSLTAGTALDIPVDLGAGTKAATAVTGVVNGQFEYISLGYATYDSANKKVTLSAGLVDGCMSQNVSSLNIVFNDTSSTTVPLTLTW